MRILSSDTVSRRTSSIGKSPQIENDCSINYPQYLCKNKTYTEYELGDLTTSIKRNPRKRLRVLDSNSLNGLVCGKTVSRDSLESDADAQLQAFCAKPQLLRKPRRNDKTNNLACQLKNIKELLSSPEWTNALKPSTISNEKSENQMGELVTMNSTAKLVFKYDSSETADDTLEEHRSSWQNSTSSGMNWRDKNSDLPFTQMNDYNKAEIPTSGLPTQDSNANLMGSENVLLKSNPKTKCFWDSFAVQSEFVSQFQPISMPNSFFNNDYNHSSNVSFELTSIRSYQSFPLEFFK